MIVRIESPPDHRAAPIERLRTLLPFAEDAEARAERQIVHRLDLAERVKK